MSAASLAASLADLATFLDKLGVSLDKKINQVFVQRN